MERQISLDEMKVIENQILKYFKLVCEENNLRYYLAYGTLLGAVRHKGFIPWDDDIDVMMPRPDYLKLVEIMKNENHEFYQFISMHNNKHYFAPLAKIYDKRTILIQEYGQVEKTPLGVYIDIFVLDGLPTDIEESNKLFRNTRKLRSRWGLSVRKFSAKSRTRTRAIIKTIFSIPYRIIGFRFFLKRLDSLSATFDYDSSEYVGILCFGEGPKERLHKSRIEKPSLVLFEGEYYNAPSDCDYYLTNMYGNYWELPPENARVSKHMNKSYWKKTHEVRESNGEMNQKDKKEEKGH